VRNTKYDTHADQADPISRATKLQAQRSHNAWREPFTVTADGVSESEINAAASEADRAQKAEIARTSGPARGAVDIIAYWDARRDHENETKYRGPAFPSFEDWKRGARP
jgi:hypothetical protein